MSSDEPRTDQERLALMLAMGWRLCWYKWSAEGGRVRLCMQEPTGGVWRSFSGAWYWFVKSNQLPYTLEINTVFTPGTDPET